jgi:hypothetical protein
MFFLSIYANKLIMKQITCILFRDHNHGICALNLILNIFAQAALAVARALSVLRSSNTLASPISALAIFCVRKLNLTPNRGNA